MVESFATSFSSRARLSTGAAAAFSVVPLDVDLADVDLVAGGLEGPVLEVAGLDAAGVSAANAETANSTEMATTTGTATRSFTDGNPPLGGALERRRILPRPWNQRLPDGTGRMGPLCVVSAGPAPARGPSCRAGCALCSRPISGAGLRWRERGAASRPPRPIATR